LVGSTFLLVAIVFVVFDSFVRVRNNKIQANAARSNAIITTMFSDHIRDQLLGLNVERDEESPLVIKKTDQMKNFLAGGDGDEGLGKPLAHLFLETTVIFADICGFTAWSSMREPGQILQLLETGASGSMDCALYLTSFSVWSFR